MFIAIARYRENVTITIFEPFYEQHKLIAAARTIHRLYAGGFVFKVLCRKLYTQAKGMINDVQQAKKQPVAACFVFLLIFSKTNN